MRLREEYVKIDPMLTNQAWNGPDGALLQRADKGATGVQITRDRRRSHPASSLEF
jgi:hypothetical protein